MSLAAISKNYRFHGCILFFALLLGIGLRVHGVEQRSLSIDELATMAVAQYHPWVAAEGMAVFERVQVTEVNDAHSFLTTVAADQSPLLYPTLEKLALPVFGLSELSARLPAMLASVAVLLWYAYLLLRESAPFWRRVWFFACILLCVHPVLVMYAQEGRAYGLGVSLIAIAVSLWLCRWRDGPAHWSAPGPLEIVILILAGLSHYHALLLAALLLITDAAGASVRRQRLDFIGRTLPFVLVVGAWLFLNHHAILHAASGHLKWSTLGVVERLWLSLTNIGVALHFPWLAILGVISTWLFLVYKGFKRPALAALLFGVLSVNLGLAILVAAKAGMAHPRYYFFSVPMLTLLLAIGLASIRPTGLATLALLALLGTSASSGVLKLWHYHDDFRSTAAVTAKTASRQSGFLYSYPLFRDIHRVNLQRFLGWDPQTQMLQFAPHQDPVALCPQLAAMDQIYVLGHLDHLPQAEALYQACSHGWPRRREYIFENTYLEHWQK